MNNKILTTIITSSLMLASCSGSKSGGAAATAGAGAGTVTESATATATPGYIGGTAAVGAPLGLANVKISCSGGGSKTGKTNSLGVYSVDVSAGCAAPFHVKVSSSNGEVETIAVNAGTIVNVTPLTQLIARRAVGNADLVLKLADVSAAKMKDAQDAIKQALKEYAVAINASSSPAAFLDIDLVAGSFSANGSGIDKLLDLIKIEGTGTTYNIKIGVTPITVDVDSTVAIIAPDSGEVTAAATAAATTSTLLDGVRAYTKSLTAAFKNGRPSEDIFNQMMDANLLHQGKDREKLYEDLDGSDVKGLEFRNVVIIDSNPNNFWVAFQIFGIENGSYSLWNTWTSKVDLDGNGGKGTLLGNRLPVGLWPAFIKHNQINGTNQVVPASSSYKRALEVGSVGYQNTIEFKEYNGVAITGGSVKLIGGLVDPNDSRLVDNLSAEFIVVHPNDAKKSITKVTFAENGGSNQEAYVYIPQEGEEDAANYVTLSYPSFLTGVTDNCRYAANALPTFSGYTLSNTDFDLAGLEIYFMNYPNLEGYPGFAAYSWDQLTEARFSSRISDYVSKTTTSGYLEIGKMDVAKYTINDVAYHTIYTCE